MGVWERSWGLTKTSFEVIRADKEMIWFPILAGLFSIFYAVALIVPAFVLEVLPHDTREVAQYVALFFVYFGLSFIATFFNVCAVYTTKTRLEGGDATFMESIRFAASRVHLIAAWSAVAATVGLLLRALENASQRAGLVGKLILTLIRALLATAWSVVTVFVIPSMVYRGLGPIAAIKMSIQTLKKTWGESLIRHYGLGLAGFVCSLPFVLMLVGAFAAAGAGLVPVAIIVGVIGVVGLLTVSLLFGLASTVFNTALFHYATTGEAQNFDAELLRGAFGSRR